MNTRTKIRGFDRKIKAAGGDSAVLFIEEGLCLTGEKYYLKFKLYK